MSTTSSPPTKPLITILGATGTGKSELAVTLARRLNGEIINGDALQLYQGLHIVTNKITAAEQHGIRHHLLGTVPLNEHAWTVSQFTSEVFRIVKDIRGRGKVPILVGGTHYYLHSTLFRDALVHRANHEDGQVDEDRGNSLMSETAHEFLTVVEQEAKWPVLKASPEEIRAELVRVDPIMASKWHPQDARKIRRSLVIYLQTGRLASDIYEEQAKQRQDVRMFGPGDASDSGSATATSALRFDNLLFWTYSKLETLDIRLEKRVESMIQRGLLDEIDLMHNFRRSEEQQGHNIDTSRGIWIAIGYKEFAQYLQIKREASNENTTRQLDEALAEGKERTFFATRQYARHQNKWTKHKLYPSLKEAGIQDRLYVLDSTDISVFSTEVEDKATAIAKSWLEGENLPRPETISEVAAEVLASLVIKESKERSPHICEHCQLTVMTEKDWEIHLGSRKHKRVIQRLRQDARNPRRGVDRGSKIEAVTGCEEPEDQMLGIGSLTLEDEQSGN